MKIRHRVPTNLAPRSEPVSAAYQAEIDQTMRRAEKAYRTAEKRLRTAERQLEKARASRAQRAHKAHLADLEQLVERRRDELADVHRLMVATARPSTQRGRGSHRGVPNPTTPL